MFPDKMMYYSKSQLIVDPNTLQKIIVKTTVLVHLTILQYGLKQPISRQNNFDGLI